MSACLPEVVEQAVRHVLVRVNGAGKVSCLPEELDVSGANVLICFELDSAGWVFPETGAVVVAQGGKQFPIPSWTVHHHLATLLDCDTARGSFQYTVTVEHVGSGRRASVDPTIRNET